MIQVQFSWKFQRHFRDTCIFHKDNPYYNTTFLKLRLLVIVGRYASKMPPPRESARRISVLAKGGFRIVKKWRDEAMKHLRSNVVAPIHSHSDFMFLIKSKSKHDKK